LAQDYKAARCHSACFMTALDIQKINSGVYFTVAALLIVSAAMLAGRKVQRNLKGKWIASVVLVSLVTFALIWLSLSMVNRRQTEPRPPPPDYPAPSATP